MLHPEPVKFNGPFGPLERLHSGSLQGHLKTTYYPQNLKIMFAI